MAELSDAVNNEPKEEILSWDEFKAQITERLVQLSKTSDLTGMYALVALCEEGAFYQKYKLAVEYVKEGNTFHLKLPTLNSAINS